MAGPIHLVPRVAEAGALLFLEDIARITVLGLRNVNLAALDMLDWLVSAGAWLIFQLRDY